MRIPPYLVERPKCPLGHTMRTRSVTRIEFTADNRKDVRVGEARQSYAGRMRAIVEAHTPQCQLCWLEEQSPEAIRARVLAEKPQIYTVKCVTVEPAGTVSFATPAEATAPFADISGFIEGASYDFVDGSYLIREAREKYRGKESEANEWDDAADAEFYTNDLARRAYLEEGDRRLRAFPIASSLSDDEAFGAWLRARTAGQRTQMSGRMIEAIEQLAAQGLSSAEVAERMGVGQG